MFQREPMDLTANTRYDTWEASMANDLGPTCRKTCSIFTSEPFLNAESTLSVCGLLECYDSIFGLLIPLPASWLKKVRVNLKLLGRPLQFEWRYLGGSNCSSTFCWGHAKPLLLRAELAPITGSRAVVPILHLVPPTPWTSELSLSDQATQA